MIANENLEARLAELQTKNSRLEEGNRALRTEIGWLRGAMVKCAVFYMALILGISGVLCHCVYLQQGASAMADCPVCPASSPPPFNTRPATDCLSTFNLTTHGPAQQALNPPGTWQLLHGVISSVASKLMPPATPPPDLRVASLRWVAAAYASHNRPQLHQSSSIQQLVHRGQQQLMGDLQEAHAIASALKLHPRKLQQLSAIAADTAAYTAALAARVAELVTPSPSLKQCPVRKQQPQQQLGGANATASWERLAYTHAGRSWEYNLQLVQPGLARLTAAYTSQVQQVVSAAQEKGLPSADAAEIRVEATAAAQHILARSSSILQPQQLLQPQESAPIQQEQQPHQQQGWRWVQLAYAASGRSTVYDAMILQQHLTQAMTTATDLGVSPAAVATATPVIESAVMDVVAGITAAADSSPLTAQQVEVEDLEMLHQVDLTAVPVNTTEPAAYAPTNSSPAAQQSQLPPLALMPVCITPTPSADTPCDCSCSSAAQELLEGLMALEEPNALPNFEDMAATARKGFKVVADVLESTVEAYAPVAHKWQEIGAETAKVVLKHARAAASITANFMRSSPLFRISKC